MDSDGLLGQEDKGLPGQAAEQEAGTSGGPSEMVKAETVEGTTHTLPVVHSVVFKADSSRAEGTDQLMNLLRSPALKAEAAQTPQPTLPPASSGGFTQLLRALNYEQAKEPAAPEPGKAAGEAASAPMPPSQAPPAATRPVTSFQTQPVAGGPPGSFTQLFQSAAPRQNVPEAKAIPPIAAPGTFTQMFRALDAAPVEAVREERELASQAAGPGAFTQMFATVGPLPVEPEHAAIKPAAAPVAAATPQVAAAAASGSFTQMFRALDAAPVETKESAAAPAPAAPGRSSTPVAGGEESPAPSVTTPAAGGSPGSFTQMFRALDAAPPAKALAEPPVPQAGSAPGTFTQMFQAVSVAPVAPTKFETVPAAAAPGTFTQMFSTSAAPGASEQPRGSQPSAVEGSGSFTQMFRTLDAAPPPPAFTPFESAAASSAEGVTVPSSQAAAGGLTQLLRTLDQPSQSLASSSPPPVSAVPHPAGTQPGSFTSVYGKLPGEAVASQSHAPVPAPSQRELPPLAAGTTTTQAFRLPQSGGTPTTSEPSEAGPSEFTRILNASMLRESALKGDGPAPLAAAPAAPPAGDPPAPPWAMPAAPKPPAAPKLPEVKLSSAPKAPAVGGMQQYLPLLLILIIFLLLAILVAVVFLMKR